jgi:hypothetical protein
LNKAERRTSHVSRVYDAKLAVKAACGYVKKSKGVLLCAPEAEGCVWRLINVLNEYFCVGNKFITCGIETIASDRVMIVC